MKSKGCGVMEEGFAKISARLNPLKTYWNNLKQCISAGLTLKNEVRVNEQLKQCSWVTLVEKAKVEWEESQVLFNEAKNPALIDYAIYAMVAAERKYMYLLNEARKEKVRHEDIYYILNKNSL